MEEVLLKIRVGLWFAGHPPLDRLDSYVPEPSLATEGTDALCAVREDLRRLRGSSADSRDPIFGAIVAHKAAESAFSDSLTAKERLEGEIPESARQSDIDALEEVIVESDDPRWIEAVRASKAASDEEGARARALLQTRPTTLVGLLSLLRYADECDEGRDWPDRIAAIAADALEQLISGSPRSRHA
jgi:hypothetical protein